MSENKFEIIAKTFQGVEEQLAQEITTLGGEEVTIGRRMVSFKGDKEMLYRANFFCRTALRILKPIYTFTAKDTDELYENIKSFDWSKILSSKNTFAIDSVVYSEDFKHSKFAAYRVKDAIVDYFTEKVGDRPSVRVTNADIMINLHIAHHTCTISLDSSGESLHKRGYRVVQTEAPINEVLAAAMLLKAGWDGTKNLIDPMCGSGTILIEAALIATNTPPGVYRNGYAFERWSDFDSEMLEKIFNDDHNERGFEYKIFGSDISLQAIEVARRNIKSARLEKYIELEVKPIQKYTEAPDNCIMVTNPPYGERLNPRDLIDIYAALGSQLKHVFTGCDAWIISSSKEGFDNIGLKPSKKIPLMNGSIECEYRKFEVFGGKYKEYKKERSENGETESPQRQEGSGYKRPYRADERRPRREGDRENNRSFDTKRGSKSISGGERPYRKSTSSDNTDKGTRPYGSAEDKRSYRADERRPRREGDRENNCSFDTKRGSKSISSGERPYRKSTSSDNTDKGTRRYGSAEDKRSYRADERRPRREGERENNRSFDTKRGSKSISGGERPYRSSKPDNDKKDRGGKSFRFDDRKPAFDKNRDTKDKPFASKREFKGQAEEGEFKEKIHGEDFINKFVTFRQPTLGAEPGGKQFRKRKKKEE